MEGDCVFALYLIRLRTLGSTPNPFYLNLDFNQDETHE